MFKFFIVLVGFVTFFSACPAEAADVTDAKEELPTLVMLSTPSWPACMQMSKVLDTLNEKYGDKLLAMKVDISLKENMNIAAQYNVQYVPHLLFVDGKGEVVNQGVGYMPEEDVLLAFEEAGIKIK